MFIELLAYLNGVNAGRYMAQREGSDVSRQSHAEIKPLSWRERVLMAIFAVLLTVGAARMVAWISN